MKLVYTVGLRLTAFLRECSNHSYRKMKIPLISLINSIKNGLNNNSNKIIVKLSRTNIKLLDILVAERFIVSYTIIKKSIIVTLGSATKLNSSIRELAVLSKPERNVIILMKQCHPMVVKPSLLYKPWPVASLVLMSISKVPS